MSTINITNYSRNNKSENKRAGGRSNRPSLFMSHSFIPTRGVAYYQGLNNKYFKAIPKVAKFRLELKYSESDSSHPNEEIRKRFMG